jgi:hypothetical protein
MMATVFATTPGRQSGAFTLLFSVVILLLTTILVVAVSRTSVMEQRISANEFRARQAFEAAQAGIEAAAAYLSLEPGGADRDLDDIADNVTAPDPYAVLEGGTAYSVGFCDPDNPPEEGAGIDEFCPSSPGAVLNKPGTGCDYLNGEINPDGKSEASQLNSALIVACGWSDDRLGRRVIRQGAGIVPALAAALEVPLISKDGIDVSGSVNVVNYFTPLTIWTGGPVASIGAGKTFTRNPAVALPAPGTPPPAPPGDCSTTTDYVCLTDKNNTGPDVIENDPTLGNLDAGQLFASFFGHPDLAAYKTAGIPSQIISGDGADPAGSKGQVIVIEHDGATLLPNATIGSRERPVILIIGGALQLQGNPTVFGLVYVMGDVSGGGNLRVNGSLVIAGKTQVTGNIDIVFDPFINENARLGAGRPGLIPGAWRDWR